MRRLVVLGFVATLAACDGQLFALAGPAGEASRQGGAGDDSAAHGDGRDRPHELDIPREPDGCVSTRDYFNEVAQPGVFSVCVECHRPGGVSAGTRFVLFPDTVDGFLTRNYDAVDAARGLTIGGEPLLLLKPTGAVPHGGHTVIAPSSEGEHVGLWDTRTSFVQSFLCSADRVIRDPGKKV